MHKAQSATRHGLIRPRPWAAAFTVACAALLTFALPLAAPTLNAVSVAGLPLGYYFAAQGALILVAFLGIWLSGPWRTATMTQRLAAFSSSLSAAGSWLTAGVVLTLVGGLFVYGHDGLPLLLGMAAGLLVSLVFIAPALDRAGALHLDDMLGRPTGSASAAAAAGLGMATGLVMLLSIELEVFSLAIATLAPGVVGDAAMLVAVGGVAAFVLSLILGRRARSVLTALALVAIAVCVWVLVWALAGYEPRSLLPQIAYGEALTELTGRERTLLVEGLADPVSMPPFARPFVQVSWMNFVALTLSMLLGAAVLPHMLWRRSAAAGQWSSAQGSPTRNAFPSRHKAAFGLVVAAVLLTALPAAAVFAKLKLYSAVSAGIAVASEEPEWIEAAKKAGYLQVCPEAPDTEADLPSCGDSSGRMRIADLALNPAAAVLMMPALAGLGARWTALLSAMVAFLALIAAAATLRMATESATGWTSAQRGHEGEVAPASPALSLPVSIVLAALAVLGVIVLEESPVNRLYWAFALFGASVFPMVLLKALMPRISGAALALGGLTGLAICLYYVIGTTSVFAPQFALYWSTVSDAPPWLIEELNALLKDCAIDQGGTPTACHGALELGRELANWFGVDGRAGAALGAPAGILVALLASVLSPSFWRRS